MWAGWRVCTLRGCDHKCLTEEVALGKGLRGSEVGGAGGETAAYLGEGANADVLGWSSSGQGQGGW